jgi:signal transduction histidine kinase/CheY-like chemotaxis protein
MGSTDIAILIGAQIVVTLLAVSVFVALRQRDQDAARAREAREDSAAHARGPSGPDSQTRTRFLATVSHEIRTPLNGVMGLAQLLDMTRLDAEQASYVEAIMKSGRALAQLIDDILDFSQIEAGKFALRSENFELTPLVEGVVELLAPRAGAKGLEIASIVSSDAPPRLTGDPARLRQALINLVGNAVNYTDRGGVGLRVYVKGPSLRFDVRDSGPGVPAAAREAIFEEFERANWSTKPRGGAGLGLAISRRLVQLMGGALTLSDTSDAGSTFSIILPLTESVAPSPPQPLLGHRVLIIAQSLFEAPFLAESLTSAGAVATIMAGAPAIDLLTKKGAGETYHAILLDCALGPEAISALVKSARLDGARLFLLFSPLERRAFGEAALRDVDGWLVKPVRKASLLTRLSHKGPDAPTSAAGALPFPVLDGLRVLVAEDNDVNALIVTRALGKFGAEVTRVGNGAEAVVRAAEGLGPGAAPFDAILMDLFLPELDGRDATREIRAAEAGAGAPRTPIVIVTASVLEEDARAARAAGADALLTKPVDLAQLAATLDELRVAPAETAAATSLRSARRKPELQ